MAKKNKFSFTALIITSIFAAPIIGIYIIFLVFKFVILAILSCFPNKNKKFISNRNINDILINVDNLSGFEFEEFVATLLIQNGYRNVNKTKSSGDFGADIIAEKGNIRYAIQCKRFNSKIGPKPIGEVLRGKNRYNCNAGIVITNNYFTKQAIQEGKISDIELWDRNYLINLILNSKLYDNI